jgi:hypothetical protein
VQMTLAKNRPFYIALCKLAVCPSDAETEAELAPSSQWDAFRAMWFWRLYTGNALATAYDVRSSVRHAVESLGIGDYVIYCVLGNICERCSVSRRRC